MDDLLDDVFGLERRMGDRLRAKFGTRPFALPAPREARTSFVPTMDVCALRRRAVLAACRAVRGSGKGLAITREGRSLLVRGERRAADDNASEDFHQ